jgi:hypothetical protein
MLSYLKFGNAWVMVVIVVLTFTIGIPYIAAGQSDGYEECMKAKQDYIEAKQAYHNAKAVRDSRSNESAAAGIGALGRGSGAGLMGLFANTTRNASNQAQNDMNYALQLMQDANSRMAIFCKD